MVENKKIKVLLVDDDIADVELAMMAVNMVGLPYELKVVSDGEQAMRYLAERRAFNKSYLPDIIILDLNLPKMNGREVLVEIRKDPEFSQIQVFVLSTFKPEEDFFNTHKLERDRFFTKPLRMEEYIPIVKSMDAAYQKSLQA